VKNDYGIEQEARALNGLEEPFKKNAVKSKIIKLTNIQFRPAFWYRPSNVTFRTPVSSILGFFSFMASDQISLPLKQIR
jgi:hypothetical protein